MKKIILMLAASFMTIYSIAQTDSIMRSSDSDSDEGRNGLNHNQSVDTLNQNQDSTKQLIQKLNDNSYENKRVKKDEVQIWSNDRLNPKSLTGSMQDCVMMKKGKMMMMRNGIVTTMDPDMIMTNGTRVMIDGGIYVKDGMQTKMREGQYMDMSGNMMTMQISDSGRVVNASKAKPFIRN